MNNASAVHHVKHKEKTGVIARAGLCLPSLPLGSRSHLASILLPLIPPSAKCPVPHMPSVPDMAGCKSSLPTSKQSLVILCCFSSDLLTPEAAGQTLPHCPMWCRPQLLPLSSVLTQHPPPLSTFPLHIFPCAFSNLDMGGPDLDGNCDSGRGLSLPPAPLHPNPSLHG